MISVLSCCFHRAAGREWVAIACYEPVEQRNQQHSLLAIPTDILGISVLPFLRTKDVVILDSALCNQQSRKNLHEAMGGTNSFRSHGVKAFLWLLARGCKLDSFCVTSHCSCPLDPYVFNAISGIKHLTISSNKVPFDTVTALLNNCSDMTSLSVRGSSTDWQPYRVNTTFKLTKLDLMYNTTITDEFLVPLIRHCPLLETLHAGRHKLRPGALLAAAQHCPLLREIQSCVLSAFPNPPVEAECEAALSAVVNNCTHLTTLRANVYSPHGFFRIGEVRATNLKHVALNGHFTLRIADPQDDAIVALAVSCTNIEKLELTYFSNNTDVSLHAIANHLPQLHTLHITEMNFATDAGVGAVRSACSKLTSLQLRNCANVRGAGLSRGPLGVLTDLAIDGATLTEDNLISCTQHNYNILTLQIGARMRADAALALPPTALSRSVVHLTHLTEFRFWCCEENPESKCVNDELFIALGQHCRKLVKLNLYHGKCVTSAGFGALSNLRLLQELTLDHCTQLSNASLTSIAQSCTNMRRLSMKGCAWVTSPGICAVAQHCRKLAFLYIVGCSWVRDHAILELVRCLPHLATVVVKDNYLLSTALTSKPPCVLGR